MLLASGADGGDDDDVQMDLWIYAGYNIPKKTAASPERHPTPLGTTTVPRQPQKLQNVSCTYDRMNGWNSTLRPAWYTWYLVKVYICTAYKGAPFSSPIWHITKAPLCPN